VLPEGAIEMGGHSLTMGPDASHHVHFAGRKLVVDATVQPETQAVRPGGGRVTFDAGGRAVFDQTIFALRSKFDATVWSSDRGGRFEYDVPQRVVASARGALGEKVTVTIDAKRLLYKEDVLGEMSPLSRFLVSIMAAPMSYTYENRYELRIDRPGSPAEHRTGA